MPVPHEDLIEKVHDAVDALLDAIKHDGQIDDDEAKSLVDLVQDIEDKLIDTMTEYGVEVGDERID